jgi:hypothetical protein
MANNTLTRRALLNKLIKKLSKKAQQIDPLFEKYSRKVFNGRQYSDPKYTVASNVEVNENVFSKIRVVPVTSGLNPQAGVLSTSDALHLLRRTGFGYRKADADRITGMPISEAVDLILAVDNTPPSPPINNYETIEPDENQVPYGADWTNSAFSGYDVGSDTNGKRTESLNAWLLGLAINQDITIREKMSLFWYHFIPIDFDFVLQSSNEYANTNSARICYKYMKMFRDSATGNYKTLIRTMATQPAMMFYLNNQANTKTAPDENFAREIMELFTLGKDEENVYTQADVVEAAKVLTGWRVENLNTVNEATNFVANKHDESNKKFSAFFNNTVIPSSGAAELDLFIDMIFSKPETISKYICRRLYRFFVYYDIDQNIENNVITPLAQLFVASNWDIKPVLERLFKSEHFFDMANRGVYIKSPFDLIVGTMRIFNVNTTSPDATNHELQYRIWLVFNYIMGEMQQKMGSVPTVSGWQAFYQKPSFHEYWINSSSIQRRYSIIEGLLWGFDIETENKDAKARISSNLIEYIQQFPASVSSDPNLLVAECIKYLLPIDLSAQQKEIIKTQSLLTGQTTDSYWTEAWSNYTSNPTNEEYLNTVKFRITSMFLTIVRYAEYQLA